MRHENNRDGLVLRIEQPITGEVSRSDLVSASPDFRKSIAVDPHGRI